MGGRRGGALLLLAAVFLVAALPSCSAAASTTPPNKPMPPTPPGVNVGGRRSPSSVVFPIHGNVYPSGLYFVTMHIGEPPKPYFLDIDTGSDLTWLQCNAPCHHCSECPHPLYKPAKNRLVPCNDPLCLALPGHRDCSDNPLQCDYEIEYADHSSSLGVLVTDAFAIRLTNSSIARPHLAFGCGYDQQGSAMNSPSPTDGVLGLGSGKTSILSQLRDQGVTRSVVGHCFGRRGGGYLFFGDALIPSFGGTWAPMSRNPIHNYYSPGPASLFLGKQSLGVKLQAAFDSGSSYTYFANQPYQAFLSAVKNDLSKTPLKEAFEEPELPICWKGPKPFRSLLDVKNYFRSLVLGFGKKSLLEIPPESYLIITKQGNVCLGILNGTEVGLSDLNVIGDISMQDLMVVYDNDKQQIGWFRTSCDRLPNADDNNGFEEGFSHPQFTSMGILTEEYPAHYKNPKTD